MLETTKTLTQDAKERGYAVGAFNVPSMPMARGVVAAAEASHAPVILQLGEKQHDHYLPLDLIGPALLTLAKNARVPVSVHLDHGFSFAVEVQALKLGFPSVMIDMSQQDLSTTTARTKEIVKIAHALGASVEGEIGPMNREGGGEKVDYAHLDETYTDPGEAAQFAQDTGVDLLAVAFGTVHGIYSQTPHLSFSRLRQIAQEVDVPLVMHGGSGLEDDDYRQAVQNGISKINYFTNMAYHVANEVIARAKQHEGEQLLVPDLDLWTTEFVQQEVTEKLTLFGAAGRA